MAEKDTLGELRDIAKRYGWELVHVGKKNFRYVLTRGDRTIEFSKSGRGYSKVGWARFHFSVSGTMFTTTDVAFSSREQFAEAILSGYSDTKFIESTRTRLTSNVAAARSLLTAAEIAMTNFDEAVRETDGFSEPPPQEKE